MVSFFDSWSTCGILFGKTSPNSNESNLRLVQDLFEVVLFFSVLTLYLCKRPSILYLVSIFSFHVFITMNDRKRKKKSIDKSKASNKLKIDSSVDSNSDTSVKVF